MKFEDSRDVLRPALALIGQCFYVQLPQCMKLSDIRSDRTEMSVLVLQRNGSSGNILVRFEVFMAVTMKNAVFWDI
jgi:hypothetical protein